MPSDKGASGANDEGRAWRKAERARLLAARLAMPSADHKAACGVITKLLGVDLIPRLGARVVAAYWPIRAEFDCRPLLGLLHETGVGLALPIVLGKAAPLEFSAWSPGALLETGMMNIPQPTKRVPVVPDVLLVPVVGFDRQNYRLGYGAGHYDRTLAGMSRRPVTIGVGFSFQQLETIHPHAFDIALDYIVTEAGIQEKP